MFPNDTIPTIDPVAAAMLAKVPGPAERFPSVSTGSNNRERHGTLHDRTSTSTTPASTIHFSTSDSVFVRGSIFDDNEFDPFGSGALNETLLPGFGYNLRTHTDNLSATWTHVFNTSWLNELRFGWMWVGGGASQPQCGQ